MDKQRKYVKNRNRIEKPLWNKKERIGLKVFGLVFLVGVIIAMGYLIYQDIVRRNYLNDMAGKELPHNRVCMVGNVLKFKELNEIAIDNKPYSVCCPKCKVRLLRNNEIRFAVDPVSNNMVDKANAIITQNPKMKDKVLYFETRNNIKKYKTKL